MNVKTEITIPISHVDYEKGEAYATLTFVMYDTQDYIDMSIFISDKHDIELFKMSQKDFLSFGKWCMEAYQAASKKDTRR